MLRNPVERKQKPETWEQKQSRRVHNNPTSRTTVTAQNVFRRKVEDQRVAANTFREAA